MASNKIKAQVWVNDSEFPENIGVRLHLTDAQAAEVLEAVVTGEPLYINLITGTTNGKRAENPAAYAQ